MTATARAPSEWLPTRDAAKLLGVSPRELLRKVKSYPRQFPRQQQKLGRIVTSLYSREHLIGFRDRTKRGMDPWIHEKQMAGEAPDQLGSGASDVTGVGVSDVIASEVAVIARAPVELSQFGPLAEALAALAQRFPAPRREPKLWMTIDEAAEFSGLPKSYLERSCQAGSLGKNFGTGTRRRYRISRRELEEL